MGSHAAIGFRSNWTFVLKRPREKFAITQMGSSAAGVGRDALKCRKSASNSVQSDESVFLLAIAEQASKPDLS